MESNDKTTEEEGVFNGDPFPPIGEDVDNSAPEEQAKTQEADPIEERLSAMEQRFEAEKAEWAERERRQQETIDKLLTGQVAAAPKEQQAPPDPYDMSDLPDPVDDPKGFKAAMADKMRRFAEHQQQQQSQQSTQASSMDALWTRFQTEHPDLAKRSSHVQGAVGMEAAELRARGVDPQKAALSDPDGFLKRVANRMRAEIGMESSTDGTDQSTITTKPNRTAGVSGGSHQTKPKGNQGSGAKDFIQQMQDFQLSDGLI